MERNHIIKEGLSDVIPEKKTFNGVKPTLFGEEINIRPAILLSDLVRDKFNIGNNNKKN